METRASTAAIHREEDMHVAECPEVATVSRERSIEGPPADLREAVELRLEESPLGHAEGPTLTAVEIPAHA